MANAATDRAAGVMNRLHRYGFVTSSTNSGRCHGEMADPTNSNQVVAQFIGL